MLLRLCQKLLPGWDVADDFDVVNGVEREGKGHACCDDHLGDGGKRRLREYSVTLGTVGHKRVLDCGENA